MKKALLLSFIPLLLISCKEKEIDCSATAYKAPCNIAFKGFTPTELDTIIRNRYQSGTGFSQRLSSDTFSFPDVVLFHDTAYSSAQQTYMSDLGAGADYELIVPATNRLFRISNLEYTSDSVIRWTRKKSCGTYGTFVIDPQYATVDRSSVPTAAITNTPRLWLVLRK